MQLLSRYVILKARFFDFIQFDQLIDSVNDGKKPGGHPNIADRLRPFRPIRRQALSTVNHQSLVPGRELHGAS